jgi:hypothetical protein
MAMAMAPNTITKTVRSSDITPGTTGEWQSVEPYGYRFRLRHRRGRIRLGSSEPRRNFIGMPTNVRIEPYRCRQVL